MSSAKVHTGMDFRTYNFLCYHEVFPARWVGGTLERSPVSKRIRRHFSCPHIQPRIESVSIAHIEWISSNLWCLTANLRRPESARNEGSTRPKRLDDTRCKTNKRRLNYRTQAPTSVTGCSSTSGQAPSLLARIWPWLSYMCHIRLTAG